MFLFLFAAGRALLLLVDVRRVHVQVRQLHAERLGRRLRPQPHRHESRKVRGLCSNAISPNAISPNAIHR
jgi:hypothetical protein